MTETQPGFRTWAVLLGLYIAGTLILIQAYPRVWVDEGWIAEPGWTVSQGGPLGNPSFGDVHRYSDRLYWMPPLHFLLLSVVYRLGIDPLLGGRLLSASAGLLTLVVLIGWARGVIRETGVVPEHSKRLVIFVLLWITLAFSLDPTLWKSHRTIRFESLVGLGLVSTVALAWNPHRRLRGVLTGATGALAFLVHPNGALALVAAAGIFFLRRRSWRRSVTDLLLAAVTACLVLLPAALYYWQDRGSGFENVLGQVSQHFSGNAESPLASWREEWRRYRAYFAWPSLAVPLALWILSAAMAVRSRAPRALWWTLAVLIGGFASLPNKTEHYLTLAAPFVFVLAACAGTAHRSRWTAGAAILWLCVLLAADVALLRRARTCDYTAWTRSFADSVPPGAPVAGTLLTWFPLREHPYVDMNRNLAGDLADQRPQYVVWGDSHLDSPHLERLRRELGPFLASHADTVAVAPSWCYGEVVLVRPRWEELSEEEASHWERWRTLGSASE